MDPKVLLPDYLARTPYGISFTESINPVTGDRLQPHPLLPSKFNAHDCARTIEVANDGMDVMFGTPRFGNDSDAGSVRADNPIPKSCEIYYFEAKILSAGVEGFIGIGFCRSDVKLNRLPGWETGAWGYHGDDGHTFCGSGVGRVYGPTFTAGDHIGCCLNFREGIAFYTKNGVQLATAFRNLRPDEEVRRLYPTVGLRSPGEHVRVNFGTEPFMFDIEEYVNGDDYVTVEAE